MVQVTLMEIMMTERNGSRDGVGGNSDGGDCETISCGSSEVCHSLSGHYTTISDLHFFEAREFATLVVRRRSIYLYILLLVCLVDVDFEFFMIFYC